MAKTHTSKKSTFKTSAAAPLKAARRAASASSSASLDSRHALLQEAKRVFAAKGFDGATVKDLATAAGVNISLVSYHFGGKEGLYRTCLESFGIERVEATERILRAATSNEDFRIRLKLFAEDFVEIFVKEHDTCKMIHRGLDNLDPITAEVFQNVFLRVFNALLAFINSGQETGILRENFDGEITAGFLMGSLMHLLRSQDIARLLGKPTLDEPGFRDKVIDHWVETFTSGIFADRSQKK